MPYRKSQQTKPKRRARSAPVLDELVKQFSDRYAFLRELVQNAIDAGATRVRVGVTREGDDRTTFIEDDGSGMTLEVIKGPFLTKFSSSKEGDSSKIGRYGVGFLSVFALRPRLCVVDTETAEAGYAIELEPSFAYRVSKRPALGKKGTRVAIIEAVTEATSKDADHLALVEVALLRWCRFATIAIDLEVGTETRSLNRDLALSAPVTVDYEQDGIRVLVGPTPGTRFLPDLDPKEGHGDFAGFYSRGLTLVEVTSGPHILDGLRYRVECSAFAHTISRDDVVHNSAYELAKRLVRELGDGVMVSLLERSLSNAAAEASQMGTSHAKLPALVRAGQVLLQDGSVLVPALGAPGGVAPLSSVDARAQKTSEIVGELCERGLTVALDPSGTAPWLPDTIKTAESLLSQVVAKAPEPKDRFTTGLLRVLWGMGLCLDRALLVDAKDVDGHASRVVQSSEVRRRKDGALHVFLPTRMGVGDDVLLLFTGEPSLAAAMRLPPRRAALLAARLVWLEQRGELPRRVNLGLLDASRELWSGT